MIRSGPGLDSDSAQVLLAVTSFIGMSLSNLDLLLKLAVSAATLVFLIGKIAKLRRDWRRSDDDEDQ